MIIPYITIIPKSVRSEAAGGSNHQKTGQSPSCVRLEKVIIAK